MKRKRSSLSHSTEKTSVSRKTKGGSGDDEDVVHHTQSGQLDMKFSSSKRLVQSLNQSQRTSNLQVPSSSSGCFNSQNLSLQFLPRPNKNQKPNQPFRDAHSLETIKIPYRTSTPIRSLDLISAAEGSVSSHSVQAPIFQGNNKTLEDNEISIIKYEQGQYARPSVHLTPPATAGLTDASASSSSLFFQENKRRNLSSLNNDAAVGPSATTIEPLPPAPPAAGYAAHFETTLPLKPVSARAPATQPTIIQVSIPPNILETKSKLPDMRTKAGQEWIENQVKEINVDRSNGAFRGPTASPTKATLPPWLLRHKDGALDTNNSAVQHFLHLQSQQTVAIPVYDPNVRGNYYRKKLENKESNFYHYVKMTREQPVEVPPFFILANSEILKSQLNECTFESVTAPHTRSFPSLTYSSSSISSSSSSSVSSTRSFTNEDYKIPTYIPKLDYETLENTIGDKALNKIGSGAFAVVYKGYWNGQEVAIKKLFLDPLTTGGKGSFMTELKILASFGDHPNLVQFYGYTTKPCSLVMEFVKLGSLSHLLYYCEDDFVEAKLCDGRIKKRIVSGIVNGMRQLHSVNIIHGDLKPANILVTGDFTAKITDFGLARLRGKTSGLVASNILEDEENVVAGTAAYMAPELLDSASQQQLSTDVYSFGILVNEFIHEEEPYSQDYEKFRGRGRFGAANLAKLGHRPYLNNCMVSGNLAELIRRCWNSHFWNRPSFDEISKLVGREDMIFPNII